jgi:NADPH-dependent 2,4-dienoyl-CoA reductase/sulfur reductase-like enzyme
MSSVWLDMCSVNPKMGIAHRVGRMVDSPAAPQKVAVIGGGPAGMKAAIVAAERGHAVTLYEKSGVLGGLLHYTGNSPFRWPLRDFKEYLIRQVEKCGVAVHLKTEATPEMIKAKAFDALIVATGADPIRPRIPGADGKNVWDVVSVYANEKSLGKNVVLIGSGEYGVGTAGFLARAGHRVTVLTSGKELVQQAGPHQMEILLEAITALDNFDYILEANPSRISNGEVIYTDADDMEKSIPADDVVIYAGLKSKKDEALKFYGAAKRFFIIGDCRNVGSLQTCNRTAFAAASQI